LAQLFFISLHFLLASAILFWYKMGMLPITIRKKTITETDLELIQATVKEHWDKGRTQISEILCKKWNWVQPNGRLKDMACREVLLILHRKGFLTLPPRFNSANNDKRNRSIPIVEIDQTPLQEKLSNLPSVKLKLVRNTPLEPLYNSLVQQHHYLGYRQIVGNHLKYNGTWGRDRAGVRFPLGGGLPLPPFRLRGGFTFPP
jgi:hypothetical protein